MNYAVLDKNNKRIAPADWQRYCATAKSPWIDVWARQLSTTAQPVPREVKHFNNRSEPTVIEALTRPRDQLQLGAVPSLGIENDLQEDSTSESSIELMQHQKAYNFEDAQAQEKKNRVLALALARSRTRKLTYVQIPPSRVVRFLLEPPSHTIDNLEVLTLDLESPLFRISKPLKPPRCATQSVAEEVKLEASYRAEVPSIETEVPSIETEQVGSVSTQTQPFLLWSTGDPELKTKDIESNDSQYGLDDVLDEIETLLHRGHIYVQDNIESRERLAKLYRALEASDEYNQLTSSIDLGLNHHQRVAPQRAAVLNASWQDLLFEVIRQCDTVMSTFCSINYEHAVLQKFGYARAALFKVGLSIAQSRRVLTLS